MKSIKQSKLKIVEVTWFDAQSSLDEMSVEDLKKMEVVETKSCGYLMHQDKEKIVLVFMVFGVNALEEPLMKHYQVIPMGMVKKIVEVKV